MSGIITIITNPVYGCYTFVVCGLLAVWIGYIPTGFEIKEDIVIFLILFGIVVGLLITCKVVFKLAVLLDQKISKFYNL